MKNTILLALISSCCAVSAHAASVTFSAIGPVTAGGAFDISVLTSGVFTGLAFDDALLGYGFNVSVGNGAVVSFTGETAGALFTDISSQFLPGGIPQVAGIATSFGLNPGDFSEPLTLAVLHFTALSAGSSTITVSSTLSDPNQGLTYFESPQQNIGASGSVNVSAAVPEPATFAMAFLALGAFAAVRIRR